MVVSHRPNRKVSGKIHEATGYGKIRENVYATRKSLAGLKNKEELIGLGKKCVDTKVGAILCGFAEKIGVP